MAKLPAFQCYPSDWLTDEIALCSLAAQGLWLRMMFLMHNSTRYGHLCNTDGSPLTNEQIAKGCGCGIEEYTSLLAELDRCGKPSRTRVGVVYSRRMVRDAESRANNRFRQSTYRNHNNTKKNSNANITNDVTPLSQPSSSSSSITKTNTNTKATPQAAFLLPDWVPVEPWEAFVAMRKRIRAPLSDRAKAGIVRDLVRLQAEGCDIAEVLDQSEKKCWRGVFALPGAVPERRKEERFETNRGRPSDVAFVHQGPEMDEETVAQLRTKILERERNHHGN